MLGSPVVKRIVAETGPKSHITNFLSRSLARLDNASTASGGAQGAAANGAVEGQKPSGPPSLAFWQNRSISLVDMYLDQGDPSEKCGELNFGLEYDFATQTLKLKINQGRDLKACDANGLSDPYVRVTLLPDKKHRLETKIKRRTLNPRWNETFFFEGFPINKLQSRVLHLHCYDYDRFSKDDSIGEIHLPLCQVRSVLCLKKLLSYPSVLDFF